MLTRFRTYMHRAARLHRVEELRPLAQSLLYCVWRCPTFRMNCMVQCACIVRVSPAIPLESASLLSNSTLWLSVLDGRAVMRSSKRNTQDLCYILSCSISNHACPSRFCLKQAACFKATTQTN
eukprot:2038435-Amphidinium_carterae.1